MKCCRCNSYTSMHVMASNPTNLSSATSILPIFFYQHYFFFLITIYFNYNYILNINIWNEIEILPWYKSTVNGLNLKESGA